MSLSHRRLHFLPVEEAAEEEPADQPVFIFSTSDTVGCALNIAPRGLDAAGRRLGLAARCSTRFSAFSSLLSLLSSSPLIHSYISPYVGLAEPPAAAHLTLQVC